MAAVRVSKVHHGLLTGLIDTSSSAVCLLESRLGLRGERCQSLEGGCGDPRDKLGVTKSFIVSAIAQELSCIFEEEAEASVLTCVFWARLFQSPLEAW